MSPPAPSPRVVSRLRVATQTRIIQEVSRYRAQRPAASVRERKRYLEEQMRHAAELLVPAVEHVTTYPGDLKKRIVVQEVLRVLETLETRYDLFPAWLQPWVFRQLRNGVDAMVQAVFDLLSARGTVNTRKLPR